MFSTEFTIERDGEMIGDIRYEYGAFSLPNHPDISIEPLPRILSDQRQMVQLMQNLMSNAIKFHGEEKPRVLVSATSLGRFWKFEIKDNGIGIAPEHSEGIFQMFQRLHTVDEHPGTGIGLAIAKKIVERHGGRIWVESEEGKGATFYFTIRKECEPSDYSEEETLLISQMIG